MKEQIESLRIRVFKLWSGIVKSGFIRFYKTVKLILILQTRLKSYKLPQKKRQNCLFFHNDSTFTKMTVQFNVFSYPNFLRYLVISPEFLVWNLGYCSIHTALKHETR